jgi:hypothetical protein
MNRANKIFYRVIQGGRAGRRRWVLLSGKLLQALGENAGPSFAAPQDLGLGL